MTEKFELSEVERPRKKRKAKKSRVIEMKKKDILGIVLLIAEIMMVFLLAAMLTNTVKATTLVDGNQIYTTNDSNNTNVTNNVYQPYVPEFPFFYPYPYYGYRYYGWSFFYWGDDEPRTYASSYTYTRTSSSLGGSRRYIVYPSTEDDGYGVLSPKSVKINSIERNGEKVTYEEEPIAGDIAGDINEARSHANAIGSTVEGEQNNIRSTTKTVEDETVGDSPKESLPGQGASNPQEVQEVTSNQQNRESEGATSEGVTSERSGVQSGEDESIVNEAQSHASNGISEVPEDNYHPEENTYENTENTYENTESSSSSSSSEE